MVGHYWLRAAGPRADAGVAGRDRRVRMRRFKASWLTCTRAGRFTDVLLIGIGGSALGPQFVERCARARKTTGCGLHFFDNTDPDGIDRVLERLAASARAHAGRRHLQIRRHAGDAQRHARGRGGLREGGPRLREARRRRDRTSARKLDKLCRSQNGWLDAFPDVGLGRRAHLRHEHRRPRAAGAAGRGHATRCSPAPRRWTSGRARRDAARTRPCCSR